MAGAPLIDEFLPTSKDIAANQRDKLTEEEFNFFKTVFDYQKQLSSVRTKVNFDIDNIEELFSILDMESIYGILTTGSAQLKRKKESLIYLIIKTLELSINTGHLAYKKFLDEIKSPSNFSFITFNYDLILERNLNNQSKSFDYAINYANSQGKKDAIKVLKLHGSANWLICSKSECNQIEILPVKALGDLYNKPCPKCRDKMIPLIVPPTWNKRLDPPYLVKAWSNAFNELKSAQKIKIIGYSLPQTDIYFRDFLTLALKDNIALRKIIVFDPNPDIGKRYTEFFENNFARRYFEFKNIRFNIQSVTEGNI